MTHSNNPQGRRLRPYHAPTLRQFGNIQAITAATKGGGINDGGDRKVDPGAKTGT